jgi:hypothetical protein
MNKYIIGMTMMLVAALLAHYDIQHGTYSYIPLNMFTFTCGLLVITHAGTEN